MKREKISNTIQPFFREVSSSSNFQNQMWSKNSQVFNRKYIQTSQIKLRCLRGQNDIVLLEKFDLIAAKKQ